MSVKEMSEIHDILMLPIYMFIDLYAKLILITAYIIYFVCLFACLLTCLYEKTDRQTDNIPGNLLVANSETLTTCIQNTYTHFNDEGIYLFLNEIIFYFTLIY